MLQGKTIVVTGSARGIGKGIAELCAKNGANVVIQDILEDASQTATEIADKYGVKTVAVVGNVAKKEDAEKIAAAASELGGGKIWGVVNNAGITRDAFLKKMTEEQWDLVMNVNLKGVFLVTQACIGLVESGGAIVNISSMVGKSGNMGQTNYCATKAGVIGFTKALAKEYAAKNIRANCIQPGFIKTPMTDQIPEKVVEKFIAQIPLGRMGLPEDIAKAVLFLLSDLSSYITGFSIEVAGGLFM